MGTGRGQGPEVALRFVSGHVTPRPHSAGRWAPAAVLKDGWPQHPSPWPVPWCEGLLCWGKAPEGHGHGHAGSPCHPSTGFQGESLPTVCPQCCSRNSSGPWKAEATQDMATCPGAGTRGRARETGHGSETLVSGPTPCTHQPGDPRTDMSPPGVLKGNHGPKTGP